jgi:hypothetical protein
MKPFLIPLKDRRLLKPVALAAAYTTWILVTRLLLLTFTTYFLTSSRAHPPHFEEITEATASTELVVFGFSALVFVLLMRSFSTSTPLDSWKKILVPERIEKVFLPGVFHGVLFATGLVLTFLISGQYRYVGFFVQIENPALGAFGVLLRMAALLVWVFSEEMIFRRTILTSLIQIWSRHYSAHAKPWGIAFITVLYCLVKMIQFDLGYMHLITLALISTAVSIRTLLDEDILRGVGFLAAILIVFHCVMSLPIFGSEFSGIFFLKYQGGGDFLPHFLTGGSSGPLSSFAFQLLLIFDIVRGLLRIGTSTKTLGKN